MIKKTGKTCSISAMEPLMPEDGRCHNLVDLSTELIISASKLSARLHPLVAESIGQLVRSMNCYYSNLIEGHNTHPRDIDRALLNELSTNPEKRSLQLEARAHISVQRLIDDNQIAFTVTSDYIKWIHREFYQQLPDELMWNFNADSGERIPVQPGQFRTNWVQIGKHIPPDPTEIEQFFGRFAQAYETSNLNKIRQVIAIAASHHRLLWIHPFLDGNGRVARLFSHAFLIHVGVGSSLWSIARGLARHVDEYRERLMEADNARQGDLDGRGNLSARGLVNFCDFFLKTCIDQIKYMDGLIQPTELCRRIEIYVQDEQSRARLPKGTFPLLREALFSGQIERGRATNLTGYKERQARTVLNKVIKAGLLVSDSPKGPLKLNFPLDVVERWFPRLYPVT